MLSTLQPFKYISYVRIFYKLIILMCIKIVDLYKVNNLVKLLYLIYYLRPYFYPLISANSFTLSEWIGVCQYMDMHLLEIFFKKFSAFLSHS